MRPITPATFRKYEKMLEEMMDGIGKDLEPKRGGLDKVAKRLAKRYSALPNDWFRKEFFRYLIHIFLATVNRVETIMEEQKS